jgi:hypothetical protein
MYSVIGRTESRLGCAWLLSAEKSRKPGSRIQALQALVVPDWTAAIGRVSPEHVQQTPTALRIATLVGPSTNSDGFLDKGDAYPS